MPERGLLLDTCALIWLSSGAPDLSQRARTAIDRADTVWVSAISAWEISLKVARETLKLPVGAEEWFDRVLDNHRLSLAALTVEVLVAANSLPWHHRDAAAVAQFHAGIDELQAIPVDYETYRKLGLSSYYLGAANADPEHPFWKGEHRQDRAPNPETGGV